MTERVRLADVIGALSVITDLGFGLPPQTCLRAGLIATELGRKLGLEDDDLRAAFYAPLLMHVGCISMSHETAALFGNEINITRAVAMTNLGDPQDIVDTLIPEVTRGMSPAAKEKTTGALFSNLDFGELYDTASAEVGRQAARQMGLPDHVQRALFQVSEAWNGSGFPQRLEGDDIAIGARLTRLAADAAFFNHIGGTELAIEAVKARAGTLHDPTLATEFMSCAGEVLAPADLDEPHDALLETEPDSVIELDRFQLREVVAAFGEASDLKTPFTQGHSGATAATAVAVGERLGLEGAALEDLRLAAYLHDVGRVPISNTVWEKPGPLNSAEWEEVRMHTYHSERIVARSRCLAHLARNVGMHHEKLDGSGYHRSSRASEIPLPARILGVADAWISMQQPRPHRPALDLDRASGELQAAANEGSFDPQVVSTVLQLAGRPAAVRRTAPSGLSEREVEVLRLVAEGLSNPEIAERLHIARRTAEHHVQHVYRKIGVSTRPGAAMFAVQHELLEPVGVSPQN